jgi:hypothetical protein
MLLHIDDKDDPRRVRDAVTDRQVLTFNEWCVLNALSERTGRRILKSGTGPRIVQLSARRFGITVRANREWQQSRERK